MKKSKQILALLCALILTLSLCACGCSKKSLTYKKIADDDPVNYTVVVCKGSTNDYTTAIEQGFSDSLEDLFGQNHITLKEIALDENLTGEDPAQYIKDADANVIIAIGDESLSFASSNETETPIIGCAVMDYEDVLSLTIDEEGHALTAEEIAKNSKETSESTNTVLESSDSDSDLAGTDSDDDTENVASEDISTDSELKNIYASKPKWDKLTNRNVTGISCSPNIEDNLSVLFEACKEVHVVALPYEADDYNAKMQIARMEEYLTEAGIAYREYPIDITKDTDSASRGATIKSTITQACNECNAMYISAMSMLSDYITTITTIANDNKVITMGGDYLIGQKTVVSIFYDSYAQGYQTGKLMYRILQNKESPDEIKITDMSRSSKQKLYNKDLAAIYELTFPKSFSEYSEFFKDYVVGSSTERLELENEDETENENGEGE